MTQEFTFELKISGPEGAWPFAVPMGQTVMGRQPDGDVVLNHQLVSRRHAQLDCTADSCTITDIGSSNGTKVNGIALTADTPQLLNDGDQIEIGPFTLVLAQTAVTPPPPPEPDLKKLTPAVTEPLSKLEGEELEAGVVSEEPEPVPEAPPPPKPKKVAKASPPASPPSLPPGAAANGQRPSYTPPPGLSLTASRYLQYLPEIYHTPFMARFLALFESIYGPIEWTVDNFDMFLYPTTAPDTFLPWLANWFDLIFDNSWSEHQRRSLLTQIHEIYAYRGTKWALSRILEIYTGHEPEIDDMGQGLPPFTFIVTIPNVKEGINQTLIEKLINHHKPAHTNYSLDFKE
jgi:phage tail-like protein